MIWLVYVIKVQRMSYVSRIDEDLQLPLYHQIYHLWFGARRPELGRHFFLVSSMRCTFRADATDTHMSHTHTGTGIKASIQSKYTSYI